MGTRWKGRHVRAGLALCGLFLGGCTADQKTHYSDEFQRGARLSDVDKNQSQAPPPAEAEGKMGSPGTPTGATRAAGQFALKSKSSSLDSVVVYGGLVGNDVTESTGGWGYGVSGVGPGGGATGYGTIGIGREAVSAESYKDYGYGKRVETAKDALSTFAIDVDTASYSIFRRKRQSRSTVPANSVRTEEFLNYFHYAYPGPKDGSAFAVHMDAAPSPYSAKHHLLRIGVQGKRISKSERKPAHLVFLVDVSGSMMSPDKLELAKRSLRILVDNLNDGDTVGLVTYAGSVREVLRPTGVEHRASILSAIEDLSSGGSTAMNSGISLAYEMAAQTLGPNSLSRVIVLSDGDANVGNTTHEEILKTIRGHVKEGVTLSTVGFGMGNYKDGLMEQLANKGNGNYYYVDGLSQAKRIFQEELGGTLEVIAKDVKIQVEFDAKQVKKYRLIGYENRDIADSNFREDQVDAGELGAGHTVTALYELELVSERLGASSKPLAMVRLRAKKPRGTSAVESRFPLAATTLHDSFEQASADFRFAVAVMGAAEILREHPLAKTWELSKVQRIAVGAAGDSDERREFVGLVK